MKEYIELGATPCEENCAQVGTDDYTERARKECSAYKHQLERLIKENNKEVPEGFSISVKSYSHDFGSYYEVVAKFDGNSEQGWDLAIWLENNSPTHWDEEAKKELS